MEHLRNSGLLKNPDSLRTQSECSFSSMIVQTHSNLYRDQGVISLQSINTNSDNQVKRTDKLIIEEYNLKKRLSQ